MLDPETRHRADVIVLERAPLPQPTPTPRWRLATRLAFRFAFVYFTLYVAFTQMLGGLLPLPVGNVPDLGSLPPMRTLVFWVARHILGVAGEMVVSGSGSGDKTFDWVTVFCLLAIGVLVTAAWSIADRRREHYAGVHKWFRLFLRFALGSTMISYGIVKVFPLQMPAPQLTRLLEPFGNFSPMGVLWYSIGASSPYEMFVGAAELAGGILLFLPRTTLLGALVCLMDTIEIFALNMTYDVPVKLFSLQLILMSLVLLAPDLRRLANVLLLNRTAGPSTAPPLLRTRRGNRIALGAQVVFGLYIVGMNVYTAAQAWTRYVGGPARTPFYGIWNVEEMKIDGHTRSPLVTDYDRWRRVVFQNPTFVSFQRMDDTFLIYGTRVDTAAKTLTLLKAADNNWKATFSFEQPEADQLILDGELDGRKIQMRTRLFDRNRFLLVSRGFNWVQERPFNR